MSVSASNTEHYATAMAFEGNRVMVGCRCGAVIYCGVTILHQYWDTHVNE